VVTLQGSANSEVSITNQGSTLVHADCDLALGLQKASTNSFLSFDFQPNTPQSIPNPLGADINLKCTITSSDASDVMFGKMVSGSGTVNGQTVPAAGISFTVKNSDVFSIGSNAGSEVQITNQGSSLVHADCDLALSQPEPRLNSFLSFDFQPNTPQSIPNPVGADINLKCTITSSDASDVMFGKMISGSGTVNGQTVPAAGISFNVKNGDVFSIGSNAGSEIQITNQGSSLVHADCDLALSQPEPNSFLSFDFQPNTAQSIPNPLGSDINLKCTITSTDASDVMFGKMISGSGTVNGQTVPAAGISFNVKNGDVFSIGSNAGSEIQITNQGSSLVHADCDLALSQPEPNSFLSFDFQSNTPQSIPNPLGSDINLKCTITSTDASDVMFGKMISGSGTVNGQTVPAAGISFTVKNGDVFSIGSNAGSEIQITNQGSSLVHADCDLALSQPEPNSFLSFDFQSNTPQSIPNPLGSDINLKCTISSTDASDVMFGKMLSGSGTVNGQTVPGAGISFTVKNGDVFTIGSTASSEIQITNQGSNLVHADCDLATTTLKATPNSFLSFDFQPQAAKSIPNPIGIDLTLKCTITSTDATDALFGKMVSGSGSVNGQSVPAAGISFTVKNGDVITIQSSSGSEVSILNQGANNVHADCDLAHSLKSHYTILKSFGDILKGGLTDLGTFDFLPNTPQTINNPLFWSISASCALTLTDASDVIKGVMTAGSGSLNGQDVPAGGLSLTVKNGDTLAITASAEAGVEITNIGANTVHAQCGLAKEISLTDEKIVQMVAYLLGKLKDLGHYDFEPNVAQSISNPLLWEVSAACSLTTTDTTDVLSGKMLSGQGSLNGQTLPDSGLQISVKNGDSLAITASGEAEVSITNLGKSNVHADCSLAYLNEIEELFHQFNKKNGKRHHKKKHHQRKGRKGWKKVLVKFLKWRKFD